jgi:choline dehydrogenase-like flavoprotein
MDHIGVSAEGEGPPLSEPEFFDHWRCLYLPRFDARDLSVPLPGRGFGVQLNHFSTESGATHFVATSFAEMLPQPENRVRLDPARRDAWGIPALHIDCAHRDMELTLAREQTAALREVAEAAGATLWAIDEVPQPPGIAIHESGTARMGDDPATSVLDPYNQCWDAQNLYVTDGACFPSQGTQNPTLTILALTARACHYALHPA